MSNKKVKEQIAVLNKGTKQVTANKASAIAFLQRAGMVTEAGKLTQTYRENP